MGAPTGNTTKDRDIVLPFLRGFRKKKMEILCEWAQEYSSLGCHRGEEFSLSLPYARKLQGES